jgi:voltage-gated potassium channel Kch
MKNYKRSFYIRFRYWFDNTLSSGTIAMILWLGLVSAVIVFFAAAIVTILKIDPQEKDITFIEALWLSLMRTLDPGNLNSDNGWPFRIVMLVVTGVGLLIVSTLIGIVNSGIERTMENLRKGRSIVNERNHILILGWSPMIFPLIKKLIISNTTHRRRRIVILADKDKIDMEDEIRLKAGNPGRTKIICRSGSTIDINDIKIVNPYEASTIVLLSPEEDIHDIYSIKTIMTLMKSHKPKSDKYHIVAEIRDRANLEIIDLIAKGEVTPIVSEELFSRITVQTSLQSGLSEVYNELLDFKGFSIDFMKLSSGNTTYGEALMYLKEGALIGIKTPDEKVVINPDHSTEVGENDYLIVITKKEKGIKLHDDITIQNELIVEKQVYQRKPQRTLLLGWNNKAPGIIRELDQYFVKGSETTVLADTPTMEADIAKLSHSLINQKLTEIRGMVQDKLTLMKLKPYEYQHVILLCYSDLYDIQSADAITLITLLNLRKISEEYECKFTIVSEMLDIRNRALAEVTHADDFIVSDRLISMIMAQLAGNIDLKRVFDELLNPGGSEIYMRPVTDYVKTNMPVNFYTVAASASRKNQSVIGYRIVSESDDPEKNYGVVLTPSKDKYVQFSEKDKLIVVTEM